MGEAGKYISSFEVSQTVAACLSDRGNVYDRNWFHIYCRKGCIIMKFDLTSGGLHSGQFFTSPPGGRHAKYALFDTNSAFALEPRKITENLDRVGRPQELSDAN
jgi:hypothetical protein